MANTVNSIYTLEEPMTIGEISLSKKKLNLFVIALFTLSFSALILSLYLHDIEKLSFIETVFFFFILAAIVSNSCSYYRDKIASFCPLNKTTHQKQYIKLADLIDDPDAAAYLSKVHQSGRDLIMLDYKNLKDWVDMAETRQKIRDVERKLSELQR